MTKIRMNTELRNKLFNKIKHMSESSEELKRIANALETIIKMVKEDQERSKKYMEDRKDD